MSGKEKQARAGKVLSFNQSGDFFFRRGMSKLDKNNLLDALAMYKEALKRDPANADIKLAIAEVLSEMNRFEESNRALFTLFPSKPDRPSEWHFGMGCNFIGMQEYENAYQSFEEYLKLDPEGEFAPEAYETLEAFSDWERPELYELPDIDRAEAYRLARLGKERIEHDDYEGAITGLEKVVSENPQMLHARNNLALAYFCVREYDKATKQVQIVLTETPDDVQAHCNMALFLKAAKQDELAEKEAAFLIACGASEPDDLNRIGITLMEMQRYREAFDVLSRLFRMAPYDSSITHRLGVCCYNLGDYMRAIYYYDRLLKIDRYDSIARYYRAICRSAAEGAPRKKGILIQYQVPLDGMLNRIHKLNDYLHKSADELKKLWNSDEEFQSLVRWGLDMPDTHIKRAMLGLLATVNDEDSELLLRDFLLRRSQPDELKKDVFGMLKQMNVAEPYIAYMNGSLIESHVSVVRLIPENVPKSYRDVMELCFNNMHQTRTEDTLVNAVRIWNRYVNSLTVYPVIRRPQIQALAAALEYLACRAASIKVAKPEVCHSYGITVLRLNNALTKLMEFVEEDGDK